MANEIQPKRSYTPNRVPLPSELETNEIAFNWADGRVYVKTPGGNILSWSLSGAAQQEPDPQPYPYDCPKLPAPATISVAAGVAQASVTWADVAGASSYSLQYRAVGSSAWVTTGQPAAPTSLAATAGDGQLELSWTAPSDPGTSAITGYVVEYTPSGGAAQTVNTGSTSASYTLTGLTNGTSYSVRVAAVNAAGTGAYSQAATGTPASGGISITGGINTNGWAGAGTSASPYTRNELGACGVGGDTILTAFTVAGGGTVTVSVASVGQHCGDNDPSLGIFKNNSLVNSIGFGSSGSRTVAVINGDVISLRSASSDGNIKPQSISVFRQN